MTKLKRPIAFAAALALGLGAGGATAAVDGPKVTWKLATWGKP